GRAHVRTLERAPSAGLLRTHGAQSQGAHRLFPRLVHGAWPLRAHGDHAPGARTLSAVSVPLPQEKRRAVELPLATYAPRTVARVVQMDDAAKSHPAQSGQRDRTAAPRLSPAQTRPDHLGSRAGDDAAEPRRSHRTARPRHPGSVLLNG